MPTTPSFVDRVAQPFVAARALAARAVDAALENVPAVRSARFGQWIFAGWVAASLLLLALLTAVHAHFNRARRSWPQATVDGTAVRLAPRTGPAVMGLVRPEIVVPTWLVSRASAERQLVLDHEREHLDARDPLLLAGVYAAASLVPWHPAVWWMLSRLRLAVELDCDARVLRHGVAPRRYGALLIDLAARHPAVAAGVPVLGLTLTNLERRLIAMTPHRRPFTFARRGALAAAALVACAMACEAPVPTAGTAPHAVDGARAGTATLAWKQPSPNGDSVVFHLNGVVVPKIVADSLRVNEVPRNMAVKTFIAKGMPKKVEYWITTDSVRTHAKSAGASSPRASTPASTAQASSERKVVASAAAQYDNRNFKGLVLIDGVVSSASAFTTLSPDRISRVDVFKGNQAQQFADPRAVYGVISITTKKP